MADRSSQRDDPGERGTARHQSEDMSGDEADLSAVAETASRTTDRTSVAGTAGGGYGVGSGSASSGGSAGGGNNASAGPATDFVRGAGGDEPDTSAPDVETK